MKDNEEERKRKAWEAFFKLRFGETNLPKEKNKNITNPIITRTDIIY
jgi:hypothetical protein